MLLVVAWTWQDSGFDKRVRAELSELAGIVGAEGVADGREFRWVLEGVKQAVDLGIQAKKVIGQGVVGVVEIGEDGVSGGAIRVRSVLERLSEGFVVLVGEGFEGVENYLPRHVVQGAGRIRVGEGERVSVSVVLERREFGLGAGGALELVRHNMEMPKNRFVGREEEKGVVCDDLRSGRMVTLVGCGGIGKTRLSKEVARAVAAEGLDEVAFVNLAGLREDELVKEAMGVLSRGKEGETRLVIIDNCEHVLEAVRENLGERGARRESTMVLCTSREPLGVEGEHLVRLDPLGLPDLEKDLDWRDRWEDFSAFGMLDDRLKEIRGVGLGLEEIEVAEEMLRTVDGLPLAIEHLAGQTGGMSLEACREALRDRFAFLVSRDDSVDDRHKTIQAAIGWSYELLSESEKEAFGGVGLFAGPFLATDLVKVTGDEGAALGVYGLWRKSLLERFESQEHGVVFVALESVRDFAREFAEVGEGWGDGLRGYLGEILESAATSGMGGDGEYGIGDLSLRYGTVREVLEGMISQEDREAVRWCRWLGRHWKSGSSWQDGLAVCERVLRWEGLDVQDRLELMNQVAVFTVFTGDHEVAIERFAKLAAAGDEAGERVLAAKARTNIAATMVSSGGDVVEVERLLRQSEKEFMEIGEKPMILGVGVQLIHHLTAVGKWEEAIAKGNEVFGEDSKGAPPAFFAITLLNRADSFDKLGDFEMRNREAERALEACAEDGMNASVGPALLRLSIWLSEEDLGLGAFLFGLAMEFFVGDVNEVPSRRVLIDRGEELFGEGAESDVRRKVVEGRLVEAARRPEVALARIREAGLSSIGTD